MKKKVVFVLIIVGFIIGLSASILEQDPMTGFLSTNIDGKINTYIDCYFITQTLLYILITEIIIILIYFLIKKIGIKKYN